MTPAGANARREIAGGLVLLGLAAVPTLRSTPPQWELGWFRAVNDLPDGLHRPVWAVMQLGALGAAPATALAAAAAGDKRLAARLAVGGTVVWTAAKVVKRFVARARPAAHVADLRVRGQEATGLGFPSGHAAVATTLAGATLVSVRPELRPVVVGLAVTVAAARVYVGAHLPLDVLGGVAIGLVVDGAVRLGAPPPGQLGRGAGGRDSSWARNRSRRRSQRTPESRIQATASASGSGVAR